MYKNRSDNKISEKWRTYITDIMTKNFVSLKKSDKYFRMKITESTSKAIEENWIRKLGIDYQIISLNICKNNQPLGIAIEGRNVINGEGREIIQRHYLKTIMPNFCIGLTKQFMVGDEILEVNGLMIYGMRSQDVVTALKKLPNNIQIVVCRSIHCHDGDLSEHDELDREDMAISFYDMNEDISSQTSTLKSNSSLFSTTSRDFGSAASVGDLIDNRYDQVGEYLRDIIGWRGPIVIEFRKQHKESLGLALEEILDPITSELIIVFKIILPDMKVGKDGRIHVGDRLLQVNGKPVVGAAFRKICQWMKSAPGGRLFLYICKPRFKPLNYEKQEGLLDQSAYNTLLQNSTLPRLKEETDEEHVETPPVPESQENHVIIIKKDDKLGLYLEIFDNGKNGCRIKKIVNGLAKSNGVLQNGDYITKINGISLRIDSKNKLEHCLKIISKGSSDYEISYITKEDLDIHTFTFTSSLTNNRTASPIQSLYPNPSSVFTSNISDPPTSCTSYDTVVTNKASFETFLISINNDGVTKLGLVLFPSLSEPSRYVAIADIHEHSLADNCKLLKINDIILSVNDKSFEWFSPTNAGVYLKSLMQSEERLSFKIKRLINDDVDFDHNINVKTEVEKPSSILSDLPDLCYCILTKTYLGYGLSLKEIKSDFGVVVNDVESESVADKMGSVKCGYRFVMIDNEPVITCSVDVAKKMVKNSHHFISFILEKPKFQEFNVKVFRDNTNSLGINIGGGINTKYSLPIIEGFMQNSACKFSEHLQLDDLIKEVNEMCMANLDHEEIIKVLRSLPRESSFKIWRKLPFLKRDILRSLNSPTFIRDYLESSLFTVTISKPVNNIPSFGINFGDVLILDHDGVGIICRLKIISSIEKDSLVEKYAPEVTTFSYLVAVNGSAIDVSINNADLKTMIDHETFINITLSRDIPYYFKANTCNEGGLAEEVEEDVQPFNISDSNSNGLIVVEHDHLKEHFNTESINSSLKPFLNEDIDPEFQRNVMTDDKNINEEADDVDESITDLSNKDHSKGRPSEVDSYTNDFVLNEGCVNQDNHMNEDEPVECMSEDQLMNDDKVQEDSSKVKYDSISDKGTQTKKYVSDPRDIEPVIHQESLESKEEVMKDDHELEPLIEESDKVYEEINIVESEEIINKHPDFGTLVQNDSNGKIKIKDSDTESEKDIEKNHYDIDSLHQHSDTAEEGLSRAECKEMKDDSCVVEPLEHHSDTAEVESEEEIGKKHPDFGILVQNDDNGKIKINKSDTEPEKDIEKSNYDIESLEQRSDTAEEELSGAECKEMKDDSCLVEPLKLHGDIIHELQSTQDVPDEINNSESENIVPVDNEYKNAQCMPEFGIAIDNIIVPKIDNTELGFHVFGGINSGPDGETLPIYVVGVERNTCNWPFDKDEPLLNNGVQLLELNGCDLSALDLVTVEKMIATTSADLSFKVLQLK